MIRVKVQTGSLRRCALCSRISAIMERGSGSVPGLMMWILGVFVWCWVPVQCHPQCLDFKPPFRPLRELQFCVMYREFGCCDFDRDQQLMSRYYSIMDQFDYHGYATCASFVQDLICQVGTRTGVDDQGPENTGRQTTHALTHTYTHTHAHVHIQQRRSSS